MVHVWYTGTQCRAWRLGVHMESYTKGPIMCVFGHAGVPVGRLVAVALLMTVIGKVLVSYSRIYDAVPTVMQPMK